MIINVAEKNERGTANSTLLTSWDLGLGIGTSYFFIRGRPSCQAVPIFSPMA